MKPLVGIFAHPDDEAFGPSGALAKFAKEREVSLICVTNGDAGMNASSESVNLGKIRRAEVKKSAQILGIKEVIFLGYKDGALSNNLYHEVAEAIEKNLKKLKPDTVMTFEPRGISGHIDHIAVSLITTFVFNRLEAIKTLLYYCELKEVMDQSGDYFIYMPPGYLKKDTDLEIDVSDVWEAKLAAVKAHVSQQHDVKWIIELLEKFPKKEYFLKTEKADSKK